MLGGADPRLHQELRRVVGAARQDHFTRGLEAQRLVETPAFDSHGAHAVEHHPLDLQVCLDREVRPLHRRMQIRHRGAAAPSFALRQLVMADAVLRGAVEVVVTLEAGLRAGFHEGIHHGVARASFGHRQRPARAVQLGLAPLVVLGALEVRQQVVESPSRTARVAPPVVVRAVAADVHHRVGRGGAAEGAPARQVDPPAVAVRLAAGRVIPVHRAVAECGHAERDVDVVARVRRACLEQQDAHVRVLAQPRCQDAARRARAHDDVVVHKTFHCASPFAVSRSILHRAGEVRQAVGADRGRVIRARVRGRSRAIRPTARPSIR